MEQHDHNGPWFAIHLCMVLLYLAWFGSLIGYQHQFDVIYDRVAVIQRQLECLPGELLVTDHEGNEYCFAEPSVEE